MVVAQNFRLEILFNIFLYKNSDNSNLFSKYEISSNTAVVVSGERLKRYIFHKFQNELSEGPFCIVYFHTTAQKDDNCPGLTILRWIYEELPSDYKDRLQFLYFVHPGLRSRLVLATFGRFFLSGGWVCSLCWFPNVTDILNLLTFDYFP